MLIDISGWAWSRGGSMRTMRRGRWFGFGFFGGGFELGFFLWLIDIKNDGIAFW